MCRSKLGLVEFDGLGKIQKKELGAASLPSLAVQSTIVELFEALRSLSAE